MTTGDGTFAPPMAVGDEEGPFDGPTGPASTETGGTTVGRNMAALFFSQAATWGISGVMLAIVPRHFGDRDYGRFAFALTYVGMFGLVGLLGTNTFLIKTTARDRTRVGAYVVNALYLKLVLGVVVTAVAVGLGRGFGYDVLTLSLIAATGAAMALKLLNDVLTAGLQGMERMSAPAFWNAAQQYVASGLGLLVIALDGGIVNYSMMLVVGAMVPVAANLHGLRWHLPRRLKPDLRLWREIVVGGLPYLAWSAVALIYGSVDIIMLKPMAGDETVGWYAVALKWIGLPTGLAATVLVALLPSLSAAGREVNDMFCRRANRALRLLSFVAMPVAAGLFVVAPGVISLLYDDQFAQSVPLLRTLSLSIPLIVITMMLGMALIASDRQRQWVLVGLVAAILNPALNLLAIPLTDRWYGNAAIGAAVVTVFTEILMLAGALVLKPVGVLDRATVGYIGRCTIAAVLMALAVAFTSATSSLPTGIVVGVAAYAMASWVLRTVAVDDLRVVRGQLGLKRS